jgi:uncharacterized protein YraI
MFKFTRARFLLIIALLTTLLVSLSAAAAQDGSVTITPAEGVAAANVRSGPGTKYTIRFALNAGQSLTVTGRTEAATCTGNAETDGWVRITISETVEGWASLCAVEVTGDAAALPVAEPTFPLLIEDVEPLPVLEGGGAVTNPDMLTETNAAVVLRVEPWLGSEAVGVIPANATVELLQMTTSAGWVQARFGEATGWVPGFSVGLNEEQIETVTVITVAEAAPSYISSTGSSGFYSGFCYWTGGLTVRADPWTGEMVLYYEPFMWLWCF